jgi:ribonucleotide reductase alpha subunit
MYVIKRKGDKQEINFNKINTRLEYLVREPFKLENIKTAELTKLVIQGLTDNIKTSDIDIHSANLAASLSLENRSYLILASRIVVNNHHKNTLNSFKDKITLLYLRKDKLGNICPLISNSFNKFIEKNQKRIDEYINYERDYLFDFFGFKTLEKSYLMKLDNKIIERPQDLFMRVAIQIHMPLSTSSYKDENVLEKIFNTYDLMSTQYCTHATPTLFNSGTNKGNFSSCFLLSSVDSLEGIMKTLTDSVQISKWSGGVGIHVSMWRGSDSLIRGTNGLSNGIVPFLRMFNDGARAFNQGGKRNGSFAIYLEPHHSDIMEFLELRSPHGDENLRCRDLFLALWVSDLFMKRVKNNEKWSTFCPDECPGLNDAYGDEYEKLYIQYETDNKQKRVYNARDIWASIFRCQKESGMPYICYKDTVNKSSMLSNVGTIKSSNLCVSGDTQILTDKGYFPIKELSEDETPIHNVWNTEKFTPAAFSKTNTNQKLLKITINTTSDFEIYIPRVIKCTPYHKFITVSNTLVEAQYLIKGQYLYRWKDPTTKCVVYQLVASIETCDTLEDTYCFNEPLLNRGIFNGILAGNCSEIMLPSDTDNYSVCNLSSICLPNFVEDHYTEDELAIDESQRRKLDHKFPLKPKMNYKKLASVASVLTENLNNVIDKNWNPIVETARSNFNNRPIGIGIQGLADVFMKFRTPFESDKARSINKKISEAIYYGSLSKSTELCKTIYNNVIEAFSEEKEYTNKLYSEDILTQFPILKSENILNIFTNKNDIPKTIGAYPTYSINGGSHLCNGKFHWELYGLTNSDLSGLFDWETLRSHIKIYGVRNSMTTAYMPTASTSQIMGCSSCFEPYVANIYKRKTLAGTFTIINKYLMNDLDSYGLWNNDIKNYLMINNGSVQNIEGLPQNIKDLYKTAWEIKQRVIMDLAADRQPFIDQSQSMNLFMETFDLNIFTSMQFYAWGKKLKTGSYYVRTREAVMPQKFTVSHEAQTLHNLKNLTFEENSIESDEEMECLLCGS